MDDDTGAHTESTLPSVVASLHGDYCSEQLLLTIVFHADSQRIGEVAALAPNRPGQAMLIGRLHPQFGRPGGALERALGDRYVSRAAVEVTWRGPDLLLRRCPASNRAQVDGVELSREAVVAGARLERGVAITLSHGIVLLLHHGRLPVGRCEPGSSARLVGSGARTEALLARVRRAAESDADVLIRGETGTGKELVAAAIHAASPRAQGPFVAVNMAAIPDSLAPAALFGAVRGAYTGADGAGAGYFRQAEGGTLFLDEVGDTAVDVQPQLLRALEQREIQVVGGRVRRVDVRVLSATDAVLDGGGDFRAALRHRLGALLLELPPLRDHPEDLGELLWHYLSLELHAAGRAQLLPGPDAEPVAIALWADLFHRCLRHNWPGNVRELRNWARAVAVEADDELRLPDRLYHSLAPAPMDEHPGHGGAQGDTVRRRMEQVAPEEFLAACESQAYEVAAIGRHLGVSRQSVYRRIDATDGLRTAAQVSVEELESALGGTGGDLRQAALALRISATGLRARARQLGLLPGRAKA